MSKDEDLELHLKTQPNSCFVNNYHDVSLKACQVNMDIQPDICVKIFQKLKINVHKQ